MNIIFLDIDGVLNNADTEEIVLEDGTNICIDLNKVAILKEICDKTDSKVVLISSLRKLWDTKDFSPINNKKAIAMDTIFKEYGIDIYGITKYSDNGNREEEITEWLSRHKEARGFLIIDDDISFYSKLYLEHLINTSRLNMGEMVMDMKDYTGIEKKHIPLAVKILEKQ